MGPLGSNSSLSANSSGVDQNLLTTNNSQHQQTVLSLNTENQQQNVGNEPTGQTDGDANGQQQQQQQQQQNNPMNNSIFGVMLTTLQTSIPFVFILFAKILHQHLIGFFIVLGFMTTQHFSNKTLLNQIQLKVRN